jgi:hypothetical protein
MNRITNHLSELVHQIVGKKNITDGSIWIQRKILSNRYYGKKRNKLHDIHPIINQYRSNQQN